MVLSPKMRRRTPDRRSPNRHSRLAGCRSARRGVAAIDYMLVLGVILPLAVFLYHYGPKIMNLVYDMIGALTAWPFP